MTNQVSGAHRPHPPIKERFGFHYRLRLIDGQRMFACRTMVTDEAGNRAYMLMTETGIYRGMVFPTTVEELPS